MNHLIIAPRLLYIRVNARLRVYVFVRALLLRETPHQDSPGFLCACCAMIMMATSRRQLSIAAWSLSCRRMVSGCVLLMLRLSCLISLSSQVAYHCIYCRVRDGLRRSHNTGVCSINAVCISAYAILGACKDFITQRLFCEESLC